MHLQTKRLSALSLCTTAVVGVMTTFASAQVTPTGPFAGDISESWESFDNYIVDPDQFMDEPTVCFGGSAQINGGGVMLCYEPGAAGFGLGTPGQATVADGVKGHGLNTGPDAVGSIVFSEPVCSFGGYWGAAIVDGAYDGLVEFSFQDANGNVIDTDTFQYVDDGNGIGTIVWVGWTSATPIKTVNYRGDYVVNDFLQASFGDCGGGGEDKCRGDCNGDGVVDVNDLLQLLADWGPCASGLCEIGFVCGQDIPWCNDDQTCACFTLFSGGVECFEAGGCITPCPNGDSDCPVGSLCAIDTCCAEPICAIVCSGNAPAGNSADSGPLTMIGSSADRDFTKSPTGNQTQQVNGNPDCPCDFDNDGDVDVNDLLTLLAAWGPCPDPGGDCEVGYTCGGELIECGTFEGFTCLCFTHFSGQPVCAANSSCDIPCPNGDSDCPSGYFCIIDTCCATNVCLQDCGGNQIEDCEVGFTCGDELTPCPVDPVNCICVTEWDGTPACVDISGGSSCDQFVFCNNGPDACPTGTACIINTCCADAICIPLCEGGSGNDCEVGFTCGDLLTQCPGAAPDCFCWTGFNGDFVCGNDGSCGTTCFDGICPTGMVCIIDSCCGEPTCIFECGEGEPSECEIGFTCGAELQFCGSEGQCVCFTGFDGNPVCVSDNVCAGNECDNGACPPGMVCCIDTCCSTPTCFGECEGLNPGNEAAPKVGTPMGTGPYSGSVRASGR
jgi:hypothetical protein